MKIRARALYAILALAFIATLPYSPYEGSFALKVFPILLLFGAVVASAPFRGKWLLVAAVVFSGAGDVILDLTFQGNFIAGLVSFLTAHIFYVALFLKGAAVRRNMILPTVLAVAFPAAMAAFLWPHLGQMQLPGCSLYWRYQFDACHFAAPVEAQLHGHCRGNRLRDFRQRAGAEQVLLPLSLGAVCDYGDLLPGTIPDRDRRFARTGGLTPARSLYFHFQLMPQI
jgi:hypothetical protein